MYQELYSAVLLMKLLFTQI